MHELSVATQIAAFVLADFPTRVPDELWSTVQPILNDFIERSERAAAVLDGRVGAREAAEGERGPGGAGSIERSRTPFRTNPLSSDIILLAMQHVLAGKKKVRVDFTSILYRQQLVMVLAYLDGFIVDSILAMASAEPRILAQRKTILWSDVVAAPSIEYLKEQIGERYAYELGWKSIVDRLNHLSDAHGVVVETPESERETIDAAEQLRHIIVHNNGRASAEYLTRTGRQDIAVGEAVDIETEYVGRIYDAALMMFTDVFVGVSRKYFGVTEFPGIVMRKTKLSGTERDDATG
jgi:hypothetical protein